MNKYQKIFLPIFLLILIAITIFYFRKNLFGSTTKVTHFTTQSADSLEGYYKKSREISQSQNQINQKVAFLAVGDIMLSRNAAAAIQKAKDPSLPFRLLSPLFQSVNFSFGNLESPFTQKKPVVGGHSLIFGAPSDYIKGLVDYNFKILNLANNHALDQGETGIAYTEQWLDQHNIKHVGTGNNLNEAWTPAVVEQNGIKICFIGASYASINDSGKTTNNYVARIEDLDHLKSSINIAKIQCNFVVVTMHAGTEYTRTPNDAQIKFAHAAIDYGADMVIGAHPHWVQTIERYCPRVPPPLPLGEDAAMQRAAGEGSATCTNPKYIFYSLGNFIFDQEWSRETKEGLTLKVTLSKSGGCSPSPLLRGDAPSASEGQRGCADDLQGGKQPAHLDSIELLPVIIENYSTPRPATAFEAKKILDKIGEKESMLK